MSKVVRKASKNVDTSKPLMRLVRLVNVMTSGHKRAFRRDASFWSDSKESAYYVQMFDTVCKYVASSSAESNKTLMEILLKKSEKRSSEGDEKKSVRGVSVQDITVRANYLYHKILETMRFVKTRSATFKDLNGAMQDIYFLYNNELTDDCLRLIDDTIKLAQNIDRPSYILELCILKRRILFAKNTGDASETRFGQILEMENMARGHLLLFNRLTSLNYKLISYKASKMPVPEDVINEIVDVSERYQDVDGLESLGIRTRFQMLMILSEFNKAIYIKSGHKDHLDKSLEYGEKSFLLLKTQPTFKDDEYPLFQNAVSNYLVDLIKQGELAKVEEEVMLLRDQDDKLFECKVLAYLLIQVYNEQDRYEDAYQYIISQKLVSNLRLYNNQIWPSRMITLCFLGAYVCVMVKKFEDANKWAKLIIQDNRYKTMPHLRLPMPFIQTISLFESNPTKTDDDLNDLLAKELRKLVKKYPEPNLKPYVTIAGKLKHVFAEFITQKKLRTRLTADTQAELLLQVNNLNEETRQNRALEPFRIPIAWMLSHLKNTKISEEMK